MVYKLMYGWFLHPLRTSEPNSVIMSRIEAWPGCKVNGSVPDCLRGPWHVAVRKVVENNPTLVTLSKHLHEKRVCPSCGQDVTSLNQYNINALFNELRNLEELAIPLPSVSELAQRHTTLSVY
jgi:hypothetical protein